MHLWEETHAAAVIFLCTHKISSNCKSRRRRSLLTLKSLVENKALSFFYGQTSGPLSLLRKHKTLPEQVQSTKEQIQQRKQKPESKASLRNCCSKREKFRSERTSRRRMRRMRSPGLLPLDVRLLPEGLSRRRPATEGARPGPGRPAAGLLTHPRRNWIPNLPSDLDNATDIRYLLDLGLFGTSIFGLL